MSACDRARDSRERLVLLALPDIVAVSNIDHMCEPVPFPQQSTAGLRHIFRSGWFGSFGVFLKPLYKPERQTFALRALNFKGQNAPEEWHARPQWQWFRKQFFPECNQCPAVHILNLINAFIRHGQFL
jgi:hypothetical protein